ncbi:hypothetical protein ACFLZZ_04335 [Nanoarchaeota archaeon]
MKKRDNRPKAFLITFILVTISIIAGILIQYNAEDVLNTSCSYMDPIIIDIFAFLGAIFLVVEGLARIHLNKYDKLNIHLLRAIRVSFGTVVFALHTLQFAYK